MNKRKNGQQIEMNSNNIILGGIIFLLLMVTGILPFVIELVLGLVVGVIALVIGLVVGAIGLVIGLFAGLIGLIVGLAPIAIPVAIIYYLVKNQNKHDAPKRKNDFDIDFA